MAEYTNEQIQNMKIIESKIEYSIAASKGDQTGIDAAHTKAEDARSAGGTIPVGQALTQEMVDAYTAYKTEGGTIPGTGLASLLGGKIFGIPTIYLLAGAGIALFFFRKKS